MGARRTGTRPPADAARPRVQPTARQNPTIRTVIVAAAPDEGAAPADHAPGCTRALRDGVAMICGGLSTALACSPELVAGVVGGAWCGGFALFNAVSSHQDFHSQPVRPQMLFGPTGDPASVASYVADGAYVAFHSVLGAASSGAAAYAARLTVTAMTGQDPVMLAQGHHEHHE